MNTIFQVLVTNVGTVYSGNNFMRAQTTYSRYVEDSKAQRGSAAGQSVYLYQHDTIRSEFIGALESEAS